MQKQSTRPSGENHRAHRSQLGKEMEDRVLRQLLRMEQQGLVSNVRRHTENQPEDQEGADFTVTVRCGKTSKDLLFGVTISEQRFARSNWIHPQMRSIHLPASFNENQVYARLLLLIAASTNLTQKTRGRNRSILERSVQRTISQK